MASQKPKQGDNTTKTAQVKSPAPPRMVMKGERKMVHHLFASSIEDCLKNVSYVPKKPELKPMPHKHFFHSVDNRGRRLTTSSMANGHFHEVTWESDPETGDLRAKSGPALHKVTVQFEDGTFEVQDLPVEWKDARGKVYRDDHQHEWEYLDSEEFTAKSVAALREANREELDASGVSPEAKPMQQARPITHQDGVTIREGSAPTAAELAQAQKG